jgi:2-polyprenyl-6-methoxyphenol hydroxylase-like FAD-dependent oxidoreductase
MADTRNDVIVVGTRVAGAATAMLLARKGMRVLAVERARFPSDTLSTHQVQLPGVVRLNRWGLLDRITAAGTPAARHVRFDPGHVVLEGRLPTVEGVDAIYSPRRTLLDSIMVDAARAAGAEVREGFSVEELMWSDGRVAGVRGRERGGQAVAETARLVIGADGKHSTVATAVSASAYGDRPVATMACYSYWSGVATTSGELYQRPGRAVAAFPTSDGLTVIFVSAPRAEFARFRTDVEGQFLKTLDMCGDLGDRVRTGDRAERFRTTPDLPHAIRVPYGPGWALVGDAGLVMDPITAQGIGNALHQAELLTESIAGRLENGRPLRPALAAYHRLRDAALRPMYDLTADLAAFRPPSQAERHLFAAVLGRQDEIDRLLGVFTGVTPIGEYGALRNLVRVLGVGGLAKVAGSAIGAKLRGSPRQAGSAGAHAATGSRPRA